MTGIARHKFALGVGKNSLLVPHRLFLYISDRSATQEEMQNFVVEIKNDYDLFFHLNMRQDGQWPDHQRLLFKVVTHELIAEPVYQDFRNRYAAALQLEGEAVAGRMLEPANNPFINERASIFHPLERYRTFGKFYRLTKPIHKQDMGTHIPSEKWIFDMGMQPKMMMTLKGNEFEIATKTSTMYEVQNPDGDSEGEAGECQRRNNRWREQKEEWVLQHTHNRHFKHMLVFAKKLFCNPIEIRTDRGTIYLSQHTHNRKELEYRFRYECLVQGVKLYNDNKNVYPGTFDRVTEIFDNPDGLGARLLEWEATTQHDYYRVIEADGNPVAPWDTFPYQCRFPDPGAIPSPDHVEHPLDRAYPVLPNEQPVHHPGAPPPFVADDGNGPRQMHYKWKFGMPEMDRLLSNYRPEAHLVPIGEGVHKWVPDQIGCMGSNLIVNAARPFETPDYSNTMTHYGKAFQIIMVRGLAAARHRVELKARVRRRQIATQLAAIDPLDVNARLAIQQPGPYSYSIIRPPTSQNGVLVWNEQNPEELRPGNVADLVYQEYREMQRQYRTIQAAQGERGPYKYPMPRALQDRVTTALAPMRIRASEFVRVREHRQLLEERAQELFRLWQRWHPGRNPADYAPPVFVSNVAEPVVVPTFAAYNPLGGAYTAHIPELGRDALLSLQTYDSGSFFYGDSSGFFTYGTKRKADILSPIQSIVPSKLLKSIGLNNNAIQSTPSSIQPMTQLKDLDTHSSNKTTTVGHAGNPDSLFDREEPSSPPRSHLFILNGVADTPSTSHSFDIGPQSVPSQILSSSTSYDLQLLEFEQACRDRNIPTEHNPLQQLQEAVQPGPVSKPKDSLYDSQASTPTLFNRQIMSASAASAERQDLLDTRVEKERKEERQALPEERQASMEDEMDAEVDAEMDAEVDAEMDLPSGTMFTDMLNSDDVFVFSQFD
ncbi:hypothetical protein BJ508DRAFT_336423 [Ascobolus immersus RN42]|uniref:Uncharacterized protein n=1 Tax=Ascobolus immersus RN42 TaxID=1160509 RepID=A0A3N4HCR0_ASCIM|nr:hypothetical protein BJ508DRAFT_336423 [Ascobolus immersus RN42]